MSPPLPAGPSLDPNSLDEGVISDRGGGKPKHNANCHFCGYNRVAIGPLFSCESCCNMFHSSCFFGRGISEMQCVKHCTKCTKMCCCSGTNVNMSNLRGKAYTCVGKCCKVRSIAFLTVLQSANASCACTCAVTNSIYLSISLHFARHARARKRKDARKEPECIPHRQQNIEDALLN